MKKIGFVDYYLSEWHANNYPGWMAELNGDYTVAYAWAEEEISPVDGVSSAQWCEKFGVTLCSSLEELCEKSDVIVVLAPSNPEKHLPYAKIVLPYGKRTYIDKTFAPDLREAEEIFAIAKKYGTPFFSTSALRYAEELSGVQSCRFVATTGSGRSVEEYIIHQIEMVVTKLGTGAEAIRADGADGTFTFRIRYADGRSANMLFAPDIPFHIYMSGEGTAHKAVVSPFFQSLMADMLRFFKEGTVSFDTAQTLEVMKIREGALKAAASPDVWVQL